MMQTPQTVVIIGTGSTGKGLAASLAGSRYRVLLCGLDFIETRSYVEELQTLHPQYDIEALSCSFEASWEADIIILAISAAHQPEVAERISKVACQKMVITVKDNREALQQMLPHSRVVQAFSDLPANAFQFCVVDKKAINSAVLSSQKEAADEAAQLVEAVGFYPVTADGELLESTLQSNP
jgi:8-hydroxy-5-deazaflavin:NADPH oxidoreductase